MRCIKRGVWGVLLLLALAQPAAAATLKVSAVGPYLNSQLQQAIDDAFPGDDVLVQEGFLYIGPASKPFILSNQKSCPAQDASCYITLKTGVLSNGTLSDPANFPAANRRVSPAYVGRLAKFQQAGDVTPAIRATYPGETRTNCASAPCISAWWRLQFLEVVPNARAGYALVELGTNDQPSSLPNNNAQDLLAEVPHHLQIVQDYLHGDPVKGVTVGLVLHARDVTVQDSYIADIKEVGRDTQAIGGCNTPGPWTIVNNYLEASTETFLTCGTDAWIRQNVTVTAATSPSQATLASVTDLAADQGIVIQVGGVYQARTVLTVVGNVITWTPALSAAPDAPGSVRWNVVVSDVLITKNRITKNPTWINPILTTPSGCSAVASPTGGTLPAGTQTYRAVAKVTTAETNLARSTASTEVSVVTTGSTSSVTITCAPTATADYYHVFGRNQGSENFRVYSTGPSLVDTGAASGGSCSSETQTNCTQAVPTTTGTRWQVKNLVEFKACRRCTLQGNYVDNNWLDAQVGYAVLLTVVNQDGQAFSNVLSDILIRDNVFAHSPGGISILAAGVASSGNPLTQLTHDVQVLNNSWEDIGPQWGSALRAIETQTGATGGGIKNLRYEHNTAVLASGANSFFAIFLFTGGVQYTIDGLIWRNNMTRHATFGLAAFNGGGLMGEASAWGATTTGASVWTKNVIADASNCTVYPGGSAENWCPTSAAWQADFQDYAGGDYRLKATSVYHNAATDGTDLGADYAAIQAFTTIALSGDNSGGPTPVGTKRLRLRVR